jgi:hypothetical protein
MKFLLSLIVATIIYLPCLSQGCSDAGFCTMGAMKPDQPFNKKGLVKLKSMEVSFYRGKTTTSPIVYVSTIDMSFNLVDDKTFLQVKLPYQAVDGNFGKTSGLGDISLALTRNLYSSEKFDIGVTVGGKIPSNNSDLRSKENGLQFPMYYQTSLGTYDFVSGISLVNRKWLFATGIQHPFNENKNQFTYAAWIPVYQEGKEEAYVRTYWPAYHLKRGTDIMFRAERNFRYARFNVSLGALQIIRINKDEVTDPNTNERVKLEGTTGTAFTVVGTFGYSFNVKSGVRLLMGKKLKDRVVNPDGLTRHNVTTISYYYRF